jgi:hypothetical protein
MVMVNVDAKKREGCEPTMALPTKKFSMHFRITNDGSIRPVPPVFGQTGFGNPINIGMCLPAEDKFLSAGMEKIPIAADHSIYLNGKLNFTDKSPERTG